MHQTRAQVSKKVPIARKGTKYVARASSHVDDSVPVVIAVRDMLGLARTAKEVKAMIHQKQLKINGKDVKDLRESIKLFGLFTADKTYILGLTQNGKFILEESKSAERPCKVTNKKILTGGKIQVNCHDGTNVITTDGKISTQETVFLDSSGKIKSQKGFDKGNECVVIKGRSLGKKGKIQSADGNEVTVELSDGFTTKLRKSGVFII